MIETKYVIIDGCAIVFSAAVAHSDMVRHHQKVEGAGFVRFYSSKNQWGEDVISAKCYGKSISLSIESRGEKDSLILTSQICGNY